MQFRTVQLSVLALAMLSVAACGKKDEPAIDTTTAMAPPAMPPAVASVTTFETGKHLDANKRVMAVDTEFGPRDTIYLSVVTANSTPTSTLVAKWTYQDGQTVDSTSQVVARTDAANPAAVTEFHIVKPSGWPVGKYKVELFLDGVSVGTKDIEVKKK